MKDNRYKILKKLGLAGHCFETVQVDNNFYIIEDFEDQQNPNKINVQMYMPKFIGGKLKKFHVANASYELVQDEMPEIIISYPSSNQFYFASPIIKTIESTAYACGIKRVTVVSNHPYFSRNNGLEALGFEQLDESVFEKTNPSVYYFSDHLEEIMTQATTPYTPESSNC